MIAVVHRGFASSLSLSLRPSLFLSPPRLCPLLVPPAGTRGCTAHRCVAPRGLICAQRERHELMHVARAGRESVGSLSRRTPAPTRIHHRATLPSFRPRKDATFNARVNDARERVTSNLYPFFSFFDSYCYHAGFRTRDYHRFDEINETSQTGWIEKLFLFRETRSCGVDIYYSSSFIFLERKTPIRFV